MSAQASFSLRSRNPDVLACIANLSNDEVFTPPDLANRMLDILADAWSADHNGKSLWANKDVRFLDPCTKSGIFLREITTRLMVTGAATGGALAGGAGRLGAGGGGGAAGAGTSAPQAAVAEAAASTRTTRAGERVVRRAGGMDRP